MLFDLRDLKNFPGKALDFSYSLAAPEFQNENQPPLSATGVVKNVSGVLTLEGELKGNLSLVCDRCGAPFEREKTLTVSCMLTDKQTDDDNVYIFSGDTVELDDIFIPELILSMDMKILCDESCDGGEFGSFIKIGDDDDFDNIL